MTPKQETALKQIAVALDALVAELSKADRDLVAKRTTLNGFRLQLEKMSADIEANNMPPKNERRGGMGRVVVDSWSLTHPLGEKIIMAERAYLEL